MVGEQLKMLSYTDFMLAMGLHSADATGKEAEDIVDWACEVIQVGLWAIEHATGIALKVHTNLEITRQNNALSSLSFDLDMNAQLCILPLGWEKLFGSKYDMDLKQVE